MMTATIETNADIGGLSAPDIQVAVLLRDKVCPLFMHDVGYCSWRRIAAPLSFTTSTQTYALPNDVEMIEAVSIAGAPSLQYIGEDADKMAAAESGPANAKPTGYYLAPDPSTGEQNQLKTNTPSDAGYTVKLVYYRTTFFADYTTSVDMNKFVPRMYQWALVEGLKKEIFFIRFGIGDPRYIAAEQEYKLIVERATDNKERARRHTPVFAK